MTLTEIANKSVGKSTWQIRNFLQEMVLQGELEVRRILRTRTGIKLQPSEELIDYQPAILTYQPTTADYFFNTSGHGGIFTDDSDQDQYTNAILQRLAKKITPRIVSQDFQVPYIPKKFILAELHVCYTDSWHDASDVDICDSRTGNLRITGQSDELIEKVHEFLKQ